MGGHFRAFSFVDRIVAFEPGVRARGIYAIPGGIDRFPACLVAEAVGQLAAWTAMSRIEFRGRPVAALASETRFEREVRPGQVLELAVEIDDCDDAAVAYRGSAQVEGSPVIELRDCLGPMLPVAEFDDPAALAARLSVLLAEGAAPGGFGGVPLLRAQGVTSPEPTAVEGVLQVPTGADFFEDHFPRRPVFPATLLLDAQLALARELLANSSPGPSGAALAPLRMTHVKVRAFTAPGAQLLLRAARREGAEDDAMTVELSAAADGRTVATARVHFGSPVAA